MTKDDETAWRFSAEENHVDCRAHYSDGALVAGKPNTTTEPKPIAGKVGTQITVNTADTKLIVGRRLILQFADSIEVLQKH